jgi:hypothetical protein
METTINNTIHNASLEQTPNINKKKNNPKTVNFQAHKNDYYEPRSKI